MTCRHNWSLEEVQACFHQPFSDLLYEAQNIHREHFDPNRIERATLLSIKTGACPEDCKYCSQSGHYKTSLEREALLEVETVIEQAKAAKANGANRFCMGAAWRSPPKKAWPQVLAMIEGVKALGMETCMTLGMLDMEQAADLKAVGLDYYNHNLDTSPEYYGKIISTRTYADRLNTLDAVRSAGIRVCCGGIVGMGESQTDRLRLLQVLATLPEHPQSVPINQLVPIEGTPLGDAAALDPFELVRMIATARILMPQSVIRLSAGRESLNPQTQALCFLAGANSIFYGEKLLTTENAKQDADSRLFATLGITAGPLAAHA